MALNPQIPLMGRQPEPIVHPLKMMSDVMGLRDDAAQYKERERQRQEAEQIRQVYQQIGFAPERENELISAIARVNPVVAEKFRATRAQERMEAERTSAMTMDAGTRRIGTSFDMVTKVAPWFEAIAQYMGPDTWDTGRTMMLQMADGLAKAGVPISGAFANAIPSAYSEEAHQRVVEGAKRLAQMGQKFGSVDKFAYALSVFKNQYKRDPQTLEELDQITQAASGGSQASGVKFQKDEVMVPDGKGGTMKVLANYNNETGKWYDTNGKELVGATPPITTQTTDEKVIEEAALNIVNNPRDLVSLRTITTMRGDQRLQVFNAIKRLDPNFNVGNVDRQIKFLDSYEDPKGRAATNRASMNNILMHASDLVDVNKEYRRTNVKLANTALNKLANQYSEVYARYMVPVTVLQNEIALYFAGGYAPDVQEKKDWDRILTGDATPNQIEAFAKSLIHVGLRRADTHNQQFKTMMGFDDPNLLTPDAVEAGKKLGMAQEMSKYGSGGLIGQRSSETFSAITSDGRTVTFPSKAARDAAVKESNGLLTNASAGSQGNTTSPGADEPGAQYKTTKYGKFKSIDGGLNWTKVGG